PRAPAILPAATFPGHIKYRRKPPFRTDPTDPLQAVLQRLLLYPALVCGIDMLQRAAPANTEYLTAGHHTLRRRLQNLEQVRLIVPAADLAPQDLHLFSRQRARHEYLLARDRRYPPAVVGKGIDR